jgi:uncharacterized protein (TIGR02996 family)
MKSINDALLEDIIEHPDDDVPRLAFADVLEETGGPAELERAKFIRVQIEIARLPEGDSRLPALRQRSSELSSRHYRQWLAASGLEGIIGPFVRGFLEGATLTAATYLKFAKRLASRTPLRTLRLQHLGPRMARLAACPHLRSISTLILAGVGMDDDDAAVLAESSHVVGLKTLDVCGNSLSVEGVEALLSSPHLQGCEVRFARNWLGPAAGAVLGRNPALARYTLVDFDETWLGNEGLAALLQSQYLGQLTELRLRDCVIGDDGVRALAQASLPALRRLDLGSNELGNAEVALLAGSALLGQLSHLDLGTNHIGNDGARALAGSALAGGLQVLSLVDNNVGDQGLQALRESSHLSAVLSLRMDGDRGSTDTERQLEDEDEEDEDEEDEDEDEVGEDFFAPRREEYQPWWNRRAW